jgi:hypothetical protein
MLNLTATVTLEILGEPTQVTVQGPYYPGHPGSYYDEPEPAETEIQKVWVNGRPVADFQELFTDDQFSEMEQALFESRQLTDD